MSIIKTLLASEIQPQESEHSRGVPSLLANLSPSFTLSIKTRKVLALSLPAWYLSWSLAPFLPEVWQVITSGGDDKVAMINQQDNATMINGT
jgi:hypothetical protein